MHGRSPDACSGVSYAIIPAPTCLGLRPGGVETLAAALLGRGLAARLGADVSDEIAPRVAFSPHRDPDHLLNTAGIAAHARSLADAIESAVPQGRTAMVLGGDDSVLIGAALAMRRQGGVGLVFLDAHADFCPPEASPTGEVSDCDLAIVTGFGPASLGNIEGRAPYLRPREVVQVGRRDAAEALPAESSAFAASGIPVVDLATIRRVGTATGVDLVSGHLRASGVSRLWIHLDCDVLADEIMPAVDYRVSDGLRPTELVALIRGLRRAFRVVGTTVTIYNPALDRDGAAGDALVDSLVDGWKPDPP